MKKIMICLLGASLMTLASCLKQPGPEYGMDFNTPEFFLARLNSEYTEVSVDCLKYTIDDKDLTIRDMIFKYDDFQEVEMSKPKSSHYLSYNTMLDGPKYAELRIYTDGQIRINYQEPFYKKKTFYFMMDASRAEGLHDSVKSIIENSR